LWLWLWWLSGERYGLGLVGVPRSASGGVLGGATAALEEAGLARTAEATAAAGAAQCCGGE
jgi:hypothetical protein